MATIKKNVRIQLYSDGEMISERLVAQTSEFYNGPKEKHNGPLRIEFTIEEKSDAEQAIQYLKQLILDLPIKTIKGTQGRKPKDINNDDDFSDDKSEFINNVINDSDNQDSFINTLRKSGFSFLTSPLLVNYIPESYKIKEKHLDNYQWLIRRTREAKDPKNDKYDPQILVGIKIIDERSEKMVLYLFGEFSKIVKLKIPKKEALGFNKTNLIKYPHYMSEDERMKWGVEHRALFNNNDKKPSKFYMRWAKDVKVGDELYIGTFEELTERMLS